MVTIAGRRHNGLVIDFSRTGLYIQTSARPEIGERLDIELTLRGRKLPMHVEVARRKSVPPQLRNVAHGGIGVRILSAPEEFYHLLMDSRGPVTGGDAPPRASSGVAAGGGRGRPGEAAAPAGEDPDERAPDEGSPQFRVRMRQTGGTRTRTLRVFAPDRDAAVREAGRELDGAWKVLEVEPLDLP